MSRRGRFILVEGVRIGGRARRTSPLLLSALLLVALAWPLRAGAQPAPAAGAPPPAAAAPSPYQPSQGAPPPGQPTAPWVAPYPPPPQGGYPYPAAPYPGAPPPGWGSPYGMPGGRPVYVELRSDDPRTRIDRVIGGARVPVCFAPCQKMLETNSLYVVTGDGVRSTSQFMLPDDRDSVRLDVQAGSTSRLVGGVVLMGLGIAVTYIGAVVWEFGEVQSTSASFNGSSSDADSSRAISVGKTMVIIGIPAALAGLYLAVTTHTSVVSSTGSTFTRAPLPRRRLPIALTPRGLEF